MANNRSFRIIIITFVFNNSKAFSRNVTLTGVLTVQQGLRSPDLNANKNPPVIKF